MPAQSYQVDDMHDELTKIQNSLRKLYRKNSDETHLLYPGIELIYLTLAPASFSIQHPSLHHIMQINYCKAGQISWKMGNGNHIYLNPGDFSLHTMQACTDSVVTFPAGEYSGLTIYIDLQIATVHSPSLLKNMDIFALLQDKFCRDNTASFLAGNELTENIFSGFYDQPENIRSSYQKLKVLELFLYLAKMEFTQKNQLTAYQSEQVEIVRKIHAQLTRNLDQRITIEELSKQYLINPTTLKTAFKAVYGTSIAAHIKKHRMEQAANMLRESDLPIAKIAQAVGYDSQSKFTVAFKRAFHVLPKEYRK